MKELFLVVTISAWLIMLGGAPTWATSTVPFTTGPKNVATIGSYTNFMSSLRRQAQDATLRCYGIPMLPNANTNPKFVFVELTNSQRKSVTLILKRFNLYVLGYSDRVGSGKNTKCRYHVFSDVKGSERNDVEKTLCPLTSPREEKKINYGSRYQDLEKKAKVDDRRRVKLGMEILDSGIGKIAGVANLKEQIQAEFLIVVVQMVAEAARYKYIEDQIKINFNSKNLTPNDDMIALQTGWGKISTAIHNAVNGVISPPLVIRDDPKPDKRWIISRVDDIAPSYVVLLHFVAGTCRLNKIWSRDLLLHDI